MCVKCYDGTFQKQARIAGAIGVILLLLAIWGIGRSIVKAHERDNMTYDQRIAACRERAPKAVEGLPIVAIEFPPEQNVGTNACKAQITVDVHGHKVTRTFVLFPY